MYSMVITHDDPAHPGGRVVAAQIRNSLLPVRSGREWEERTISSSDQTPAGVSLLSPGRVQIPYRWLHPSTATIPTPYEKPAFQHLTIPFNPSLRLIGRGPGVAIVPSLGRSNRAEMDPGITTNNLYAGEAHVGRAPSL